MADKEYGGDKRVWGRYGDIEVYAMKPKKGVPRYNMFQPIAPRQRASHVIEDHPEGIQFGRTFGGSDEHTQGLLTRSEHFHTALNAAREYDGH